MGRGGPPALERFKMKWMGEEEDATIPILSPSILTCYDDFFQQEQKRLTYEDTGPPSPSPRVVVWKGGAWGNKD